MKTKINKSSVKFLISRCLFCALILSGFTSCQTGGNNSSLPNVDYVPFKALESDEKWGMLSPTDGHILYEKVISGYPSTVVNGVFRTTDEKGTYTYYEALEKPRQIGNESYVAGGVYSEGVIPVVKKDKAISLIDIQGKEVASLGRADGKNVTYTNGYFSDGLLLFINEDGKFGYFNNKGDVAIKASYTFATPFNEGLAVVSKSKEDNMKYFIINTKGEKIADLDYDDLNMSTPIFMNGVLVCGNKVIGKDGKQLFRPSSKWTSIGFFNNNLASFCEDNQYGLTDINGEEIFGAEYDFPLLKMGNLFLTITKADEGYELALIDKNEEEVNDLGECGSLAILSEKLLAIYDSDSYYLVNGKGESINKDSYAQITGSLNPIFNNCNLFLSIIYENYNGIYNFIESDYTAPIAGSVKNASLNPEINVKKLVGDHFGGTVPPSVNIDELTDLFLNFSSGNSPLYQNNIDGFKSFINDYFETDIFSGADTDY